MSEIVVARIESINTSNQKYSLKLYAPDYKDVEFYLHINSIDKLDIKSIYAFEIKNIYKENGEVKRDLVNVKDVISALSPSELFRNLSLFYNHDQSITFDSLKKDIESFISKITNPIILQLVSNIIKDNEKNFYISIAGLSMHHSYIGGLAHHTVSMLKLAKAFLEVYRDLDVSLLYGGIILHDICKLQEIDTLGNKYTFEGTMIGHLVLGSDLIDRYAVKFNVVHAEETILLKHILISHHGQPQFGSAKKPLFLEALIISILDSCDSKISACLENLSSTEPGKFSEQINALDKTRLYKVKS
jgi:3'-5' exoribonuclease